jgi:hypothetical protein
MCPVPLAPNWFDSHQYVAIWLEGVALVLIFIWDRFDSRHQHKQTLAQMGIMQRQADLIDGQTAVLKESVAVARDGAEAAKDNAQAAILNAQAVINSERPWIVVSVRPGEFIGNFVFTATNKGRTPAVFESGTFDFTFDSYPDSLPTHPTYASRIAPDRTLIVQDDGFDIEPAGVNPESFIKDVEMTEQVKIGSQFLIFYGRVIYKDVFGRDGKEAIRHETCFCYCFDVSRGELVRRGPEEYNRFT